MTLKTPDTFIKGQLICGESLVPPISFGVDATALKGAGHFVGPLIVGDTKVFPGPPGFPLANVQLTKRSGLDGILDASPSAAAQKVGIGFMPSIFMISGALEMPVPTPLDVLVGFPLPTGVTINCGPSLFTVASASATFVSAANFGVLAPFAEKIAALQKRLGSKFEGGNHTDVGPKQQIGSKKAATPEVQATIIKAKDFITSKSTLNATFALATKNAAKIETKKGFDIPHPTKENHRLRYICPEGPTADVYVRGKLRNGENVIKLPEYWRGLVNPESITVSLTPIGSYQELFVKEIQWGSKILVRNNAGGPIDCHYVVYGERKDGEPNISEYEGLTPDDYPGDNSEYRINDN